ncbi:hypothetical protein GQ44DRAFT_153787 [Phaeosphaeriaceae sp. PMI808]|nr:hypothetical protein GQ44DRAFT_153787 [Phaeosphaeriaceae sp. PMI808]
MTQDQNAANSVEALTSQYVRQYQFPTEQLHGSISTLIQALTRWEDDQKNDDFLSPSEEDKKYLEDEEQKFLSGVAIFLAQLNQHNISSQYIISETAARLFDQVLTDATASNKQKYKELSEELNKPTVEQKQACRLANNQSRLVRLIDLIGFTNSIKSS